MAFNHKPRPQFDYMNLGISRKKIETLYP